MKNKGLIFRRRKCGAHGYLFLLSEIHKQMLLKSYKHTYVYTYVLIDHCARTANVMSL